MREAMLEISNTFCENVCKITEDTRGGNDANLWKIKESVKILRQWFDENPTTQVWTALMNAQLAYQHVIKNVRVK